MYIFLTEKSFYNSTPISSYIFPAIMVLVGCLVAFGITFVWSLRILKIRNISFLQCVSIGFISFCGSLALSALMVSTFGALKYFVFHLLIECILAVYYLKIPREKAITLSILTEIFNLLLVVLNILIFFSWKSFMR